MNNYFGNIYIKGGTGIECVGKENIYNKTLHVPKFLWVNSVGLCCVSDKVHRCQSGPCVVVCVLISLSDPLIMIRIIIQQLGE